MDDMDDEAEKSFKINSYIAGVIGLIISIPLYVVNSSYVGDNRAYLMQCVFGTFWMSGYAMRSHLNRPALVAYLVILFAFEIMLLIKLNIPPSFPGAIMLPISIFNLIIIVWGSSIFRKEA